MIRQELDDVEQELLDKTIAILTIGKEYHWRKFNKFSFNKTKTGFYIEYGCMYSAPSISFDILLKISELFGTTKINVDDYGYIGCESCDYGSQYGHTIYIDSPTNNLNVEKLYGKDFGVKE